MYESLGYHGYGLMGCEAVWFGWWLQMFWTHLLLLLLGRWRQWVSLKSLFLPTKVYWVTSWKTVVLIPCTIFIF